MINKSIWEDNIIINKQKRLDKDIDVDVLIIGGGMTGIQTAYHLINSDLKVCLVDRGVCGFGVSSKTTGKLTYLQENIYSKIKKYSNIENAYKYYLCQKDAINLIKDIINKNNISCDLKKNKSYIFINKDSEKNKIEEEKKILDKFGCISKIVKSFSKEIGDTYALEVDDTYVFHPLKYINSLKEIIIDNGISVYENTNIYKIEREEDLFISSTLTNKIKSKYIVMANHYTFFLFPYLMPLKTTLEKSYILASKSKNIEDINAINIKKPTSSIRYHDDYVIKLTGSHNIAFSNDENSNFNKLKNLSKNIDYYWSNMDVMTHDYIPLIGKISKNLLIGTGYNTWGMTNSSIGAVVLSDIILGKENEYIDLFNPKRGINLGNIINTGVSIFSNGYSFINSKINKNKSFYSDNVIFTKINGKDVGIYIDKDKNKHIVYNKCPHLKCSLIFNEVEHTWDCPCHGSRFSIDGEVILGPSNYSIKYKEQ